LRVLNQLGVCRESVRRVVDPSVSKRASRKPLSIEYGTYKTVKARFWPWLVGKSPDNLLSCSLRGVLDQLGVCRESVRRVVDRVRLPVPKSHFTTPSTSKVVFHSGNTPKVLGIGALAGR